MPPKKKQKQGATPSRRLKRSFAAIERDVFPFRKEGLREELLRAGATTASNEAGGVHSSPSGAVSSSTALVCGACLLEVDVPEEAPPESKGAVATVKGCAHHTTSSPSPSSPRGVDDRSSGGVWAEKATSRATPPSKPGRGKLSSVLTEVGAAKSPQAESTSIPGPLVGLLDTCAHVFHHECIDRWAQTENTCPQCKSRFFWLAGYDLASGLRQSYKQVATKDQEAESEEDFEEITFCQRCKEVGDTRQLLLCDGLHGTCNAAFHTYCVGLKGVPRGSWFCPDCTNGGFDVDKDGKRGSGVGAVRSQPTKRPRRLEVVDHDDDGDGEHFLGGIFGSTSSSDPPSKSPVAAAVEEAAMPALNTTCSCSDHARTALLDTLAAAAPPSARRPVNGSALVGRVPAAFRLSALATVTPEKELPTFRTEKAAASCDRFGEGGDAPADVSPDALAAGAASGGADLGENYLARAQRRRAERSKVQAAAKQRQASAGGAAASSGASFIKLAPTYEEDQYMGKTMGGDFQE